MKLHHRPTDKFDPIMFCLQFANSMRLITGVAAGHTYCLAQPPPLLNKIMSNWLIMTA